MNCTVELLMQNEDLLWFIKEKQALFYVRQICSSLRQKLYIYWDGTLIETNSDIQDTYLFQTSQVIKVKKFENLLLFQFGYVKNILCDLNT